MSFLKVKSLILVILTFIVVLDMSVSNAGCGRACDDLARVITRQADDAAARAAKEATAHANREAAERFAKEQTGNIARTKKVEPIRDAYGPHTTWKTDPQTGNITRHETWTPNPRNPSGWDSTKSTDLIGRPHIDKQTGKPIPTPHTQGKDIPGGVRQANPNEIPKGISVIRP